MLRDSHFDCETHAQAVRPTAWGGPASDHIETDDARLLFTAHCNKSSSDLVRLISSVKGSIRFVAGQVSDTGDMTVDTPVATMGIRDATVEMNVAVDINGNLFSLSCGKSPAQVQQELAAARVLFPVYQAVQLRTPRPPARPQVPQGPQGPKQHQDTSSRFLTSNLLLYGAG